VIGIYDVKTNMPLQDFRHQGIDGPTTCGNRVQDIGAIRLPFDRVLDGLHLPPNPPDTIEHFLLVAQYVSQVATSFGT
jgi:hypothetical protein